MAETNNYSADQLREIEEGKNAGIDTTLYEDERYLAIQMRQIKLGLISGVSVIFYANPGFDWFQMEEIRLGLEHHIDVSMYANQSLSYMQMRQVRKGLEAGIDLSPYLIFPPMVVREIRKGLRSKIDILEYANKGYDAKQLEQIRIAIDNGTDIDPYLDIHLSAPSIEEIGIGLKEDLDVSQYAKLEYSWLQMRELRKGLERRLDISKFASPLYSPEQMHEIRRGLERGIPVDNYRRMRYSASDMRRMRLALEESLKQTSEAGYTDFDDLEKLIDYGEKRESTYHIMMGADNMDAFLFIDSPLFSLTEDEVLKAAWDAGIHRGMQRSEIKVAVSKENPSTMYTIAIGKMPKRGVDGYYEYFFRTDIDGKPKVLPDGSVDYQNIEWFDTVKKGERIALYHPAENGIDGFNVLGDNLIAINGTELPVLKGTGFHVDEDNCTYISDFDGMISMVDGVVTVKNLLELDEVNQATGNVFFSGNVHIKGDVGAGVIIRCMNDVIIDGFVEGATIRADGDIILRSGMNGDGRGILSAGKNITGKFLESVSAYATGTIQVNSAVNCTLVADDRIEISKSNGTILGGTATAFKGMKIQNIGNHTGLKTVIRAGISDKLSKKASDINAAIKTSQDELRIFQNALFEYESKLPPDVRAAHPMYIKLQNAIYTKNLELERLNAERQAVYAELDEAAMAIIEVEGHVYEGAVIEIGGIVDKPTGFKAVKFRKLRIDDEDVIYTSSIN